MIYYHNLVTNEEKAFRVCNNIQQKQAKTDESDSITTFSIALGIYYCPHISRIYLNLFLRMEAYILHTF